MANAVEILIRARDEASASLTKINKEVKGTTEEVKKQAEAWDRLGTNLNRTGRQLSLRVTAPLTLAAGAISKLSGDFEASMNRVSALSSATGDDLERLSGLARQLGADTQFSASEAADAMGFLAQAGFQVEAIYKSMPSTLNLAAAAQLDMGSSADIVSNILTGFGLPVEQLGSAVDILTKAFISSNTNLQALGEGMKFVGPVAAGYQVSIEQTTAALGALSNAGIQGGMAGTTLRGIINTLGKETDKLGISTLDAAGAMRPLADIIDDLNATGISTTRTMEVFGDRAGPGMVALMAQGGQSLRAFTAELEDAEGTAQRVAETQMAGLNGMIKELQSAVEELALALGDAGLLAAVKAMVGGLTNFVRALNDAPVFVKQVTLVVGALAAATGPLLIGLGSVVRMLPALRTGFVLVRAAMLPFLGPAGLVVAMAAVLGTLAKRYVESDATLQTHKGWIDEVAGTYETYRAQIYATTDAERQGAIDRLATIRTEMQERLTLVQALADQQKSSVQKFLDSPFGKFLMPGFLNVEAGASAGTLEEIDRLGSIIESIGSDIAKLESGAARLVEIPAYVAPVVDAVTDLGEAFGQLGDLPDPTAEVQSWAGQFLTGLETGVETAQRSWRDTLTAFGHTTGALLRDALGVNEPNNQFMQVGQEIVESLVDGFTAAFPSFADRVTAGWDALLWGTRGLRREPTSAYTDRVAERRAANAAAFEESPGSAWQPSRGLPSAEAGVLWNAVAALVAAEAPVADIEKAVEALTAIMPMSLTRISQLTNGLVGAQGATADYTERAVKTAKELADAANEFPATWIPEGGLPPAWNLRADAASERWQTLTGTSGAPVGAPTGAYAPTAPMLAAAQIAEDTVRALVAAEAPIDQIRAAVEQWTSIVPQSVATINEVTQGVLHAANAAELAAARLADTRAFDEAPGLFALAYDLVPMPGRPRSTAERLADAEAGREAAAAAFEENPGLYQPAYNVEPVKPAEEVLQEELEARQALITQLTTMSSENSPLANFGTQLLAAAADQVPAFGAALQGFVEAGPMGAIIAFFSELLLSSAPVQEAFVMINEALAPLGELLGRIIAPALRLLGTVIGWVVDALVAIYNFLLGWLLGRIERPATAEEAEEKTSGQTRTHSSAPPSGREADFGRVGQGIQLAVATPLLEAAQLSLAAAQLQLTAANSLLSVFGRIEALYSRILDEGFRVHVEVSTPAAATGSGTAYLR